MFLFGFCRAVKLISETCFCMPQSTPQSEVFIEKHIVDTVCVFVRLAMSPAMIHKIGLCCSSRPASNHLMSLVNWAKETLSGWGLIIIAMFKSVTSLPQNIN